MTPLGRRLAGLIAANGPISVAEYMAACLFDPEHGYYTTREPFGRDGDFITAPEISQMFGELAGLWVHQAWSAAGSPARAELIEIGPGRGTLMADMLRTLSQLPGNGAAFRVTMVETSARLQAVQKATLGSAAARIDWRAELPETVDAPVFIVANELFDAIPMRQFVKAGGQWRERMVDLDESGGLRFSAGLAGVDAGLLPAGADDAPEGSIAEIAPARAAMMERVCAPIAAAGGAALLIDYGHGETGLGDTLQAVRAHEYDDALAHPGAADLTSHVDFAALRAVAGRHGLDSRLTTQGEFLLGMGLLERAGRLGARLDEAGRDAIREQVERLAGPDRMGTLFKVLMVTERQGASGKTR